MSWYFEVLRKYDVLSGRRMMGWYFEVLHKYGVFSGRASREEYWSFIFLHVIFSYLLIGLERAIEMVDLQSALGMFISVSILAVGIPSIVFSVRKLQDRGHSGWWILGVIPIIVLIRFVPGLLSGLYVVAMVLPTIAVSVRRLHDKGRNGWWILIPSIPIIGYIILLVFLLQDSELGKNKYGATPKMVLAH